MTCRSDLRTFTFAAAALCLSLAAPAQNPATPIPISATELARAEASLYDEFESTSSFATILQAANQGSSVAKRDLALFYLVGGNPSAFAAAHLRPDPDRALRWFLAAAHNGDTRSPSYIGDYFLAPTTAKPNPADALFWYRKANQLGDSRGTIALARLSCKGIAVPLNLTTCSQFLDAAVQLRKSSDPPDVLLSLRAAYLALGDDDRQKSGTANNLLADAAYAKAAALGSIPAIVAQAKLYIEPHGLPRNLTKAAALLDAFTVNQLPSLHLPNQSGLKTPIGSTYAAIGALYEATGTAPHGSSNHRTAALSTTAALYLKAANLGVEAPLIALAQRYNLGTGVPQNPTSAYNLLRPIACNSMSDADRTAFNLAMHAAQQQIAAANPAQQLPPLVCPSRSIIMPPVVAADSVVTPPPLLRSPNLIAPDAVPAQQPFTVNVSLDAVAMDTKTAILNGSQSNGLLQITLPQGMSSMQIDVALIATGMTFPSGSNQGTLILNAGSPFSIPATFKVLAGAPQDTTLYAILTDHTNSNFIAELGRKISITGTVATTPPPATQPPVVTLSPPQPLSPLSPSSQTSASEPAGQLHAHILQSVAPARPPNVTLTAPQPASPPIKTAFLPDPTNRMPDLTIVETRTGNTLTYLFMGPNLDPTDSTSPDAVIADRDALKNKVETTYFPALQNGSNKLAAGNGDLCAADRLKGDDADAKSDCSDSVYVQGVVQGIGSDLYRLDGPKALQTVVQQMLAAHAPLRYITVVSNDPVIPWELVCIPTSLTDKGCTPLGLTAAIVRQNAGAGQNAVTDEVAFNGIDIVAPDYQAPLTLPGQATEVAAILKAFPSPLTTKIEGDSDDVRDMIVSSPQGIIHFSGHGMRVALPTPPTAASVAAPATAATATAPVAAPASTPPPVPVATAPAAPSAPEVAIALEDLNMTPRTFFAFRAQGNDVHPFYFFNACDLGQSDRAPAYVDGWAADLIASGASGYLGALYEVSDATASSFAAHFYADLKTNLASGNHLTVADIVNQARQQTYAEQNDPSALAYVLYSRQYLHLIPPQ